MAESFTPPERVASAARRGLRLREKVKAGTEVGVARARDLSNRRPVSLETIGRMVSFFARHGAQKPANIGTDAEPTPWLVAWLLWGGDPGRDWAEGVWRRKGSESEAARLGLSRTEPAAPQSVCVLVPLPPDLAAQFPEVPGNGPPHVTLAYFPADAGGVPAKQIAHKVTVALGAACASPKVRPFVVALPGGVAEFAPRDGADVRPVFAVVQSPGLLALRRAMFDALAGEPWADAARDAYGGFAPHATLAYLPPGQPYDGPQPRGQAVCASVEVWVGDDVAHRVNLPGEPEAPIMMARRGPALALSREPPPAPEGMPLHNPDGLHVGRAFRVLTADETVRDGSTGEALGCFPVEVLAEFVKVFAARCAAGEGAPRIDHNHGPSRGMDPTILGAVLACYVADDGERGPGLYVVPGYTDHGRDFVAKHATPDGGSVLSNSPEFAVGPVYARGGGDPSEVGALLGGAELLGVALTGSPQQSEAIIDAVRLSRGQSTAYAAGEVSGMDPEERFAALEATLAEHAAQMGKMAEMLGAIKERMEGGDAAAVEMAVEGAAAAVEEITAEAVEEVRAAAEEQVSQLSAEEVAEVEEEMPAAMALAIRRGTGNRKAKVAAWSKRAELARAKLAGRELRKLSREVVELKAAKTEAECDAFVLELRAFGLPPGDEPAIRRYFVAKRSNPTAWAAMHGEDCPLDREVKAIKAQARRVVPLGRAGVTAQPGEAKATRAEVTAWATANGMDFAADPINTAVRWAKANGRSTKEIGL